MPRVLLVNAQARVGGAERSLVELARAVDRSRFELAAVVGEEGPLAERLRDAGVETTVVEMARLRRTVNPLKLAGYVASLAKAGRRIVEIVRAGKIDLVHANGFVSHVYAGEAARRADVPCVWHARDMVRLGPVADHVRSSAARVVAVSEAVRRHVLAEGAPRERVRLVRNGLDLSAFREAGGREEARRELSLDERAFVVGSAGVFVPWKRHEDFVRAFGRLCEKEIEQEAARQGEVVDVSKIVPARAVLFGGDIFGDQGRYAFELKKLADELVGGRLLFPGWREDLPRLLPALDVFVSASEGEPFGRVIVEAMAAGVAVVATDSGGKSEIVDDGKTGLLVPQGDRDAVADRLCELMRDPERRARLGAAAREAAFERFEVARAASEVEAVWEEVLSS